MSGKPGNVRDFDSSQGDVRDFTKTQGSVKEKKSCQGKVAINCLLLVGCLRPYWYLVASSYYWHDVSEIVRELSWKCTISGELSPCLRFSFKRHCFILSQSVVGTTSNHCCSCTYDLSDVCWLLSMIYSYIHCCQWNLLYEHFLYSLLG